MSLSEGTKPNEHVSCCQGRHVTFLRHGQLASKLAAILFIIFLALAYLSQRKYMTQLQCDQNNYVMSDLFPCLLYQNRKLNGKLSVGNKISKPAVLIFRVTNLGSVSEILLQLYYKKKLITYFTELQYQFNSFSWLFSDYKQQGAWWL